MYFAAKRNLGMRRNILAAWAAYTAWDDVVVGHDGYAT